MRLCQNLPSITTDISCLGIGESAERKESEVTDGVSGTQYGYLKTLSRMSVNTTEHSLIGTGHWIIQRREETWKPRRCGIQHSDTVVMGTGPNETPKVDEVRPYMTDAC
jgi:hypothetical protein